MIKKAAVINDLSGFGKCSLAASIAILSVMGVQPCALPTAVLSNQTGYKNYYSYDFSKHMHNFADIWEQNKAEFDGIYSGYVANASQIDFISDFISRFKKPHTKVLIDPVMGDDGKRYAAYNDETCQKMCELIKKADIITPNLTELCIIANQDYEELTRKSNDNNYLGIIAELALKTAEKIGAKVIVTGIKMQDEAVNHSCKHNDNNNVCLPEHFKTVPLTVPKEQYIYSGVFSSNNCYFTRSKQLGGSFSGTGDIFSSIVFASVLNDIDVKTAVNNAAKFIEKAVADTIKSDYDRNDGINFEKYLYTLAQQGTE